MATQLPPELSNSALTGAQWDAWVKTSDAQIRVRLERGVEDTIANLLRFGVTFTSGYRIDDEYFLRWGTSASGRKSRLGDERLDYGRRVANRLVAERFDVEANG